MKAIYEFNLADPDEALRAQDVASDAAGALRALLSDLDAELRNAAKHGVFDGKPLNGQAQAFADRVRLWLATEAGERKVDW